MPQQGAPADFGGMVLPNPNNIRPMADTDQPGGSPTQLQGATLGNGMYYGGSKMDASNPAAAQMLPGMMQPSSTIGGHPLLAQHGLINSLLDLFRAAGANVGTQYSANTDAQAGSPTSLAPGTDYAMRLFSGMGDQAGAANAAGYRPAQQKADKIKKMRKK